MTNLPHSKPIEHQQKTFHACFEKRGIYYTLFAYVSHDDDCKNGHNTFSITGELREESKPVAFGCLHTEIAKHFPKLAPLIKWHLVSTDGPLHYIENALYWAGLRGWCNGKPTDPPNAEHLKSTIVFGACPSFDNGTDPMQLAETGKLQEWLESRLPCLLGEFKKAVESVGFTY